VPESVSRIPFSLEEEHTLGSMARWMRFMAVVGICAALLMLLFLVLGIGVYSSMHGLAATSSDPRMAKVEAFIIANGALPYLFACVFLVAAGIALWQNMVLFHAGDDFHLVATTDTADLDYLASGLDRLRMFFKIQVLTIVITVSLAFVSGVVVVGMWGSRS
jgi:hypothetical protein